MNSIQMRVHGFLESNKTLRNAFEGQKHFKKLLVFPNFIEIFYCCMTKLRNKKYETSWPYLFRKTVLIWDNLILRNF